MIDAVSRAHEIAYGCASLRKFRIADHQTGRQLISVGGLACFESQYLLHTRQAVPTG